MSIFKKKEKVEIIVPLEDNLSVQAFAEEYAKPDTSIEVEAHGTLYRSSGNLVSVRFTPKEDRDRVALAFLGAFKERKPVVGKRLMFCH